jgi:lysophospholipase L1-like esterase
MFGTNDARLDAPRVHVPVDRYAENLTRIIEACQAGGAKVVVCTILPIESAPYFKRHKTEPFEKAGGLEKVLDAYRAAAVHAAKAKDAVVVDLGERLPKEAGWATRDGVHPTDSGAQVLAKLVAEVVKPLLDAPRS